MTSGIFIDGGYIGEITKNVGVRLDFERVRDFVGGKSQLYGTYYYYAMPYQSPQPTADESDRFSKTDKFLQKLRQIPNFEVKLGKTQRVFNTKTKEYDYNQKMVDVMLAVDLVRLSMDRTITRAILMAGDSDFVYAIKVAKEKGVDVELYYYQDKLEKGNYINDDLFNVVTERKLMDNRFFEKCRSFR